MLVTVLLIACIVVEIYHLIDYHSVWANAEYITKAIHDFKPTEEEIEQYDNLLDACGITPEMLKKYVISMILEVIYWIILVALMIIMGLPGVGLFLIMIVMSCAIASIRRVLQVKMPLEQLNIVTVVDALISIGIYAAYLIIYCLR